MSKLYLFQELFNEKDPLRLDEYMYCVNKNIDNTNIQKIYLVYHTEEFNSDIPYFTNLISNKIKKNTKVELIPSSDKRFTFGKFSELVSILLPEESIALVANLDVFIPEIPSWNNIDTEFFSVVKNDGCLALCRTEYINDVWQYREETSWKAGEYADCWIFKMPLKFTKKDFPFDVAVGNAPQCDNFMFGFLTSKYKRMFNWAEKYTVYHFDLVRKPKKVVDRCGVMMTNDKTLALPKNDMIKHVTPYQDWSKMLQEDFIVPELLRVAALPSGSITK